MTSALGYFQKSKRYTALGKRWWWFSRCENPVAELTQGNSCLATLGWAVGWNPVGILGVPENSPAIYGWENCPVIF